MTAALEGAGPNTPPHHDGHRGADRNGNRWPWVALAAIVIGVAAAAQTGPGRDVISRVGLANEADRYTALSFAVPDSLGEPAGDHVSAAVAIANHEGASRDYTWTVSVGEADDRRTLTSGVDDVADGATVVIDPIVANPCTTTDNSVTSTRQRITVALSDPVESIGFWLTCPTAGGTP